MAMVPFKYPLRSITVRRSSALFSAIGIGCTVGVLGAILALREGFTSMFVKTVPDDLLIYLRPGATSEGESAITKKDVEILKKERPEIMRDAAGAPLAAAESFLAVYLDKIGGGMTNVPIRGIEEASLTLCADDFKIVDGRNLKFGANELIVGRPIVDRIANCRLGDTLMINTTPFKVVGIFDHHGPYRTELWFDADRLNAALERPVFQRVVARMKPGTNVEALAMEMEHDKRVASKVMSLREYLDSQKVGLSIMLMVIGTMMVIIMGIAAVLGATTTMLASIGSRTREVGILLALGFGRFAIFLAFLLEAALIGLIGGAVGCLATLSLNGIQTGTMNPQTFTESAFAFHVSPRLLLISLFVATLLGVLGGAIPAWRAARLLPTVALRRH